MTDQVLRKKAIAVTGGASGIGWAVTSLLYSPGACVYVADINDESLNVLKEEHKTQYATISGEIHTTSLDVRDSAAVNTWIQTVAAHSGRPLDGAVNIAGVSTTKTYPGGIFDVSDGDWDMMIGINLTGTCYSCCALSGPGIMKNGGSIVNFGSAMSKYGKGADGGYSASKHGVLGLSRSLAKELGSRSIRVNCVCPRPVRTPMLQSAFEQMYIEVLPGPAIPRVGEAAEVAQLVALLGENSKFISGTDVSIDGAWIC